MNYLIFTALFILCKASDVWIPNVVNFSDIVEEKLKDRGYGEVEFLVKLTDTIYEYDKDSRKNPIIFDVGANIGNFTIGVAQLYRNAKIYSFEPFKLSLDVLIHKTRDYKNVEIINEAVSYKTILNQPFYSIISWISPKNTISSLLKNQADYAISDVVNITTLNDFMKRKSII